MSKTTEAPDAAPENENAEAERMVSMSPDAFGALMEAAIVGGGGNPKPDTAQGVADLVSQMRDYVADNNFAQIGVVETEQGAVLDVIRHTDGRVEFIEQELLDSYSDNPRFRRGTVTATSLDSFKALVDRFGDSDSVVFARDDRHNPGLLAVLDYHRADTLVSAGDSDEFDEDGSTGVGLTRHGEYRHGWHRVQFDFPVSDEWKAWTRRNGNKMSMTEFAHFLEDNVLDVAEMGDDIPESAKRFVEMCGGPKNIADWSMLTALAKSLSVYESATVTEVTDLHGGAVNLTIAEEHDTEVDGIKAMVPTMFFIAIPIFRDGAYYRLPVRLRYRKTRGGVMFWYEMWREDRSFMDAIKDAVNDVENSTVAKTIYGSPEASSEQPF